MISSTAIFASSDIEATLAYYKDVLGFESTWTWGDPPVFGSASMGGVTITFTCSRSWRRRSAVISTG
jgi:catechol 2,3-dioxygenase-like lactoylglutathione lyase family enzyme